MMAFSNNYVCSILVDNKPLREFNESGNRTCRIPFGSEYKIRIKSKTYRRALVAITVDGTDVLTGGKRVILGAYQTVDIERFVDDLNGGNRFKFISVEEGGRTGAVQDPTSHENGLIRVQIFPEVQDTWTLTASGCSTTFTAKGMSIPTSAIRGTTVGGSANYDNTSHFYGASNSGAAGVIEANNCSIDLNLGSMISSSDLGATAEGSHSNQKFSESNAHFTIESMPITFDIWLKGPKSGVKETSEPRIDVVLKAGAAIYAELNGKPIAVTSCKIDGPQILITGPSLEIRSSNYSIRSE
jgi:hypothetical protein